MIVVRIYGNDIDVVIEAEDLDEAIDEFHREYPRYRGRPVHVEFELDNPD